jgi:quercetin dioxygenase-like cupin family protein
VQPLKVILTSHTAQGASCIGQVSHLWAEDEAASRLRAAQVWRAEELPVHFCKDKLKIVLIHGDPEGHVATPLKGPDHAGACLNLVHFPPAQDGKPFIVDFHRHDSCDITLLLQGELKLTLDDGSSATVRPGDVIIQDGTNHRFEAGQEGALLGIVKFGRLGTLVP